MRVVFIHGPVASGKLSIGRELSALTGLPLFHNHLVIDLVTSLFTFGSTPFAELRHRVWLDCFEAAARADRSFIFTYVPEATVLPGFVEGCQRVVAMHGGTVLFVELTCAEDEIERRLDNESRHAYGKLTSVTEYRQLRAAGRFDHPPMPPAWLTVASDQVTAVESAAVIADRLRLV